MTEEEGIVTGGTAAGSGEVSDAFAAELQPHQRSAISAVEGAVAVGQRSILLDFAPGTGKTQMIAHAIARLMEAGSCSRAVYVTDTRALTVQFAHVVASVEFASGRRFAEDYPLLRDQDAREVVRAALAPPTAETAPPAKYVCITTSQGLAEILREAAPVPPLGAEPFDLVIDDCQRRSEALDAFTRLCRPITIRLSRVGTRECADDVLVYRYSLQDAINDGVLADPAAARVRPAFARPNPPEPFTHTVFLAYADADADAARHLSAELSSAGFRVSEGKRGDPADAGAHHLREILREISAGDVLLYLLSPDSVGEPLLGAGLSKALDRRGADLVPTVVRTSPIPKALADRAVVDATANADSLIKSLRWTDAIDPATLDEQRFHALAEDLLRRIGFILERADERADRGMDYRAIYRDRLGFADPVDYLVQVKSGTRARPSIRDLVGTYNTLALPAASHLLLVTGVQLTSAAHASIAHAEQHGPHIRVLDGPRIKDLLLDYPDLVRRHFLRQGSVGVSDD